MASLNEPLPLAGNIDCEVIPIRVNARQPKPSELQVESHDFRLRAPPVVTPWPLGRNPEVARVEPLPHGALVAVDHHRSNNPAPDPVEETIWQRVLRTVRMLFRRHTAKR